MNKLQLPQAKLFYAVSEAYRRRKIDQTQKRILKEKIINDNVQIHEMLQQSEDELQLQDKMVALIKIPEDEVPVTSPIENEQIIQNVEQQEVSSPWGAILMNRKKKFSKQSKDLKMNPLNVL